MSSWRQYSNELEALSRPGLSIKLTSHNISRWTMALQVLSDKSLSTFHGTVAGRVRNFPRLEGGRVVAIGLGISGFLYGGLHCLAWNAPFATENDRILWRLSSVTITSTPALVLIVSVWEIWWPSWRGDPFLPINDTWLHRIMEELAQKTSNWAFRSAIMAVYILMSFVVTLLELSFEVFMIGLMASYCAARACLVVESFKSLTSLPDSAYMAPLWSQYVPHIG